jgi:hypothetical protein
VSPSDGAIKMSIEINVVRPKRHFCVMDGAQTGMLRKGAPKYPFSVNKSTSVAMAIEDALEGVAYNSTNQIIEQLIRSVYNRTHKSGFIDITVEVVNDKV